MYSKNKTYIEKILVNESEVVDKAYRIRVLNHLSEKIETLIPEVGDVELVQVLNTLKSIIIDAYNIDMYEFQFKSLKDIINKEIKNIESIIGL